jgi:hypothetical protein
MMAEMTHNFRSISDLQKALDYSINILKQKSTDLSNTIGEKLRSTDSANDTELQEFRNKIEGSPSNDLKKKKSATKNTKKKDQNNNWHTLESISIYDGLGAKGELEIYFKALEQTKLELDRITKVKQAVDDLVNKGLKNELGCVFVLNHGAPAEIAFRKLPERKKFALKMVFDVPSE